MREILEEGIFPLYYPYCIFWVYPTKQEEGHTHGINDRGVSGNNHFYPNISISEGLPQPGHRISLRKMSAVIHHLLFKWRHHCDDFSVWDLPTVLEQSFALLKDCLLLVLKQASRIKFYHYETNLTLFFIHLNKKDLSVSPRRIHSVAVKGDPLPNAMYCWFIPRFGMSFPSFLLTQAKCLCPLRSNLSFSP